MTTITIPRNSIYRFNETEKGLVIELETARWTEEQVDLFGQLSHSFKLSSYEADQLASELDTIAISRMFMDAIRNRTR